MGRPTSLNYTKYTKELLEDLYIKQNLSRGGVCKRLHIPEGSFRQMLKHYGIIKMPEKQKECREKGIQEAKEKGIYHDRAVANWRKAEFREKTLKAMEKSRTAEWHRHLSDGQTGKKQPESQKQKMREHWKNGNFDFFKSEDFWKNRRKEYSERSKKQYADMSNEDKKKRSRRLSELFSSEEFQQKRNATMREHNTYGKSKQEDRFYEQVIKMFPDTVRQYRSKLYLFNCDFYVPRLDLYIELNLHWTHGHRPYLGTEEDREKVNSWKDKNTSYYDNAIYVWTELDVRKRDIAKKNKLNYKELFNWQECEQFLDELKLL